MYASLYFVLLSWTVFAVFADGCRHRYGIVEDVPLESLEGLLALLALEPFVFSEEHPDREDHVHTLVVVFVVVVLVRDAVDALELAVSRWLRRSRRGCSRSTA